MKSTAEPTLSPRQKDILNYLRAFVQREGYPPAIRQIQEDLRISSTSVVAYNLRVLESAGFITRAPGLSRGVTIIEPEPDVITASEIEVYLKRPGELDQDQRGLFGALVEQAYQIVKQRGDVPAWLTQEVALG